MAKDKATKTSETQQREPTPGDIILVAAVAGAGYIIYRLIKGGGAPCTPGTTKCDGYNLYTCNIGGQWELTESNSPACGYIPEMWFGQNVEMGRQSFSVVVIDAGWRAENVEIGRENFSVVVIDAGWVKDNEPMAEQDFTMTIIDTGWQADNIELARKAFAVNII